MSQYQPDRWVILKISSEKYGSIYKILGSWYGGYTGSDSWRSSSGITEISPVNDKGFYEISNESGSVYFCHESGVGMSSYTASILGNWIEKKLDGVTIEVVKIEDVRL